MISFFSLFRRHGRHLLHLGGIGIGLRGMDLLLLCPNNGHLLDC
jgi:hypothetical protein